MFRVVYKPTGEILEVYGIVTPQYGDKVYEEFVTWDKSNKRWCFVDVLETELVED